MCPVRLTPGERDEIETPGLTAAEKVAKLAQFALELLGSSDPKIAYYSSQIIEEVKNIYPAIFD